VTWLTAIVITVAIFFSGITDTVLVPNEALAAMDISVVDQNAVPDIKTADAKEYEGHGGGHNDPFAGTVQELLHQVFTADEMAPGTVGERMQALLTGGNGPKYLMMTIALWIFSNLGVILSLFMVGLESRVDKMLRVVTTLIAPVGLKWAFRN
jgi:hypothetical protein